MDVLEAIRTTRAMRRLDPGRPVSNADLETVLLAATKAPSARNEQPVRFIVVTDPETRRQLGDIYRKVSAKAPKMDATDPDSAKLARSVEYLVDHMADAPVIIVVCSYGADDVRTAAGVYPAVQNLMLAARSLGLGTTLTTRHRQAEPETRAVLGIPSDVHIYAVIPMGYPLGRWGEAPRRPLSELAYRGRWGDGFGKAEG